MCFAFDAHPPDLPHELRLAPIAGGAGAELLELASSDGPRFSAALAESPDPHGAAVVVLPDVRGLYRFYAELAERLAQAGHHAIAVDSFGRTAGVGTRGEDFEYMPHVMQTRAEQIQADVAAAIAALRARTDAEDVVTVGFCFGGSMSFLAATNRALGLAGAVGFHAGLDLSRFGATGPLYRAADMRGPLLGLYGGADAGATSSRGAWRRRASSTRSWSTRGAALVLRPALRGARGGVRGRVAAGPGLPRRRGGGRVTDVCGASSSLTEHDRRHVR